MEQVRRQVAFRIARAEGVRLSLHAAPQTIIVPVLLLILTSAPAPLAASQVRVPDGTLIRLELRYDLTTENVEKGDRVEFNVALDVVVNDRVVIPKGSMAWGQVTKVKGAGKKKAKDASVTFLFVGVQTADNQQVSLRLLPTKPKKSDPKDNEVEIDTPIPGLRERVVGASKGREFAAYTNMDVLANAADPQPATSAAARPAGSAPQQTSALTVASSSPGVERVTVECFSIPSGAEILIDGEFYGHTPSILKLTVAPHNLQLHLRGHQTFSQVLNLVPGAGIITVRAALEQR
ncbi:MAG: PEGA domain-containing protein [Acidobacteria bacterium]|nr:PEGA domain-containing protein [Acidobacteriota bacterium]